MDTGTLKSSQSHVAFVDRSQKLSHREADNIRRKLKELNENVRNNIGLMTNASTVQGAGAANQPTMDDEKVDDPKTMSELNEALSEYFYESDILLTAAQLDDVVRTGNRQKRKAVASVYFKWPTTTAIPYSISGYLSQRTATLIKAALEFWQQRTCLKFEQRNKTSHDSLRFIKGGGCFSYVGRVGGLQPISIGAGCEYFGIVAHEIGHALGFFHEQARFDRDDHLSLNLANVWPARIGNFDKRTADVIETYETPYEYGSLMHYSSDEFAIDKGTPVIIARDPLFQQTIGQRIAPSFLDVFEMNRHYKCTDMCNDTESVCSNGGYLNPQNCSKCNCPSGFNGQFCDEVQSSSINGMCGAKIMATEEWQEVKETVGAGSSCSWHLMASVGSRIEALITDLKTECRVGCFHNAIQIKSGRNLQLTGYRFCCIDNVINHTFTSELNTMVLIAEASSFLSFNMQFRTVGIIESQSATVNHSFSVASNFTPTLTEQILSSTSTIVSTSTLTSTSTSIVSSSITTTPPSSSIASASMTTATLTSFQTSPPSSTASASMSASLFSFPTPVPTTTTTTTPSASSFVLTSASISASSPFTNVSTTTYSNTATTTFSTTPTITSTAINVTSSETFSFARTTSNVSNEFANSTTSLKPKTLVEATLISVVSSIPTPVTKVNLLPSSDVFLLKNSSNSSESTSSSNIAHFKSTTVSDLRASTASQQTTSERNISSNVTNTPHQSLQITSLSSNRESAPTTFVMQSSKPPSTASKFDAMSTSKISSLTSFTAKFVPHLTPTASKPSITFAFTDNIVTTTSSFSVSTTSPLTTIKYLARADPADINLTKTSPLTTTTRTAITTLLLLISSSTATSPTSRSTITTSTATLPTSGSTITTSTATSPISRSILTTSTAILPISGSTITTSTATLPTSRSTIATSKRTRPTTITTTTQRNTAEWVLSQWSDWTECKLSKCYNKSSCGGYGYQHRSRSCAIRETGQLCKGLRDEFRGCNEEKCFRYRPCCLPPLKLKLRIKRSKKQLVCV